MAGEELYAVCAINILLLNYNTRFLTGGKIDVVAERYGLTIVSFDSDFDRTERGRKVPRDLLREFGISLA